MNNNHPDEPSFPSKEQMMKDLGWTTDAMDQLLTRLRLEGKEVQYQLLKKTLLEAIQEEWLQRKEAGE